jgi:hypothetical protein
MSFPPYGNAKGAPVAGAAVQDLEFYRNGLPALAGGPVMKAKWHAKEQPAARRHRRRA